MAASQHTGQHDWTLPAVADAARRLPGATSRRARSRLTVKTAGKCLFTKTTWRQRWTTENWPERERPETGGGSRGV